MQNPDTDAILSQFNASRAAIEKVRVPNGPGVYAIFLRSGVALTVAGQAVTGLIYIGMSTLLTRREYEQDFCSGRSGGSTLRRSLGALLKRQLKLTAIPRGSADSEPSYTKYRFDEAGEGRLTEWMTANLEVGVCPLAGDLKVAKRLLIRSIRPVLCVEQSSSPSSADIKAARRVCADEARRRL